MQAVTINCESTWPGLIISTNTSVYSVALVPVILCNCCMMEEQLYQMSGDHSGSNQETTTTDADTVHLPAYLAYLSLGFKAISTMISNGWLDY